MEEKSVSFYNKHLSVDLLPRYYCIMGFQHCYIPSQPTTQHSDTPSTNLFVVFDLVVEDNAVGSFGLLPGQGNTVSGCLLLPDDCYWRGGWWETQTGTESEEESEVQWKFSSRRSFLSTVCGFSLPNSVCCPIRLH